MQFTQIKNLKYITTNNSHIDLLTTCKEYGEIPMTLNLVDTEDLHTFVDEDGNETPLEEYCKTLEIAPYVEIKEDDSVRILAIKKKAGEIIKSKYSIEWQLNHPRLDEEYAIQYAWIDNIRVISNQAETNGTKPEDIIWG